jgi:hypothetical protein
MPRPQNRRPSMLPALACSSGLHAIAAVLFGFLLARVYIAGLQPRETIAIADDNGRRPALIALERRPRLAPPARQAVRAGPVAPLKAAANPHFVAPVLPHRGEWRHEDSATTTVSDRQVGPAPKAVLAAAGLAAPAAPELASPAPAIALREEVQPSPSAMATQATELSTGGWGQNFANPLLADETALDDLRAKYHASASVQVDETGHAVKVVVKGGLPPDAQTEIEKLLMSLRYVPAECNGLRCGGTLQLVI